LEQHRHEEALVMLDAYSTEHATIADSLLWREVRGMMDYIDLLRIAHDDERNPYELDSTEVADLLGLRGSGSDRAAAWVGNLLCAAYGHCTPPLTGGDGLAKMRRRVAIAAPPETTAQAQLRIAPNPASSAVQFTYLLKDAPVDAWLTVTDAMGRVAHRVRIAQQEGSLSWGIPNLSAGFYTASLTEKGISLLSEKLIIQP
jgi:hypothetical protein